MQITSSQLTTEVCVLVHTCCICVILAAFKLQVAHICSGIYTDLNLLSMKLWGQYPDLAAFPGSLILSDHRTGDKAYPSSPLTPQQLKQEEPKLSNAACQGGARLYKPEGMQQLQTCCVVMQDAALNAWAALIASSADWLLRHCAICAAYATYISFVAAVAKMHFLIC